MKMSSCNQIQTNVLVRIHINIAPIECEDILYGCTRCVEETRGSIDFPVCVQC